MQKNKFKLMKNFILMILVILLCNGCTKAKEVETLSKTSAKDLIEPVSSHDSSVKASKGDIMVSDVEDARVSPKVSYLSFEKSVAFGEYYANIGDSVKKGDVIAKSYTEDTVKAVDDLKKQLNEMIENYAYQQASQQNKLSILNYQLQSIDKNTMKQEYIAKQSEIDHLQLTISQSASMETLEEKHLNDQITDITKKSTACEIKAPFDGKIVSLLNVNKGDPVSTSSKVVALADDSKAVLQMDFIPKSIISKYQSIYAIINGKKYDVEYEAYGIDEYKSLVAAGETPVANFKIKNAGADNLVGCNAVIVFIKNDLKNVVRIPNNAINTDTVGKYVLKIENGVKTRCDIVVGVTDGIYSEIVSGIKEGDDIYSLDNNSVGEVSDKAIIKDNFQGELLKNSGQVVYVNQKELRFDPQGGNLLFDSYVAKEGDFVKAGQVVAKVIAEKDDVTLAEKQFQLESLKKKLTKTEEDYNKNLAQMQKEKNSLTVTADINIKNLEMNQLQLDYEYQVAQLKKQQTELEKDIDLIIKMSSVTQIVAEKDCIITQLGKLSRGDKINSTSVFAKTAASNDFYVTFEDSEDKLLYHQNIMVYEGNGKNKKTKATVVSTWNDSLPVALQYPVDLLRVANPKIIQHQIVGLVIEGKVMKNVFMVDRDYTFNDNGNYYVKVVNDDGTITRKTIMPGGYNDKYCWTVYGINGNMKLVKNTDK